MADSEVDPSAPSFALLWEKTASDELFAVVQFAFLRRPLAELIQACHDDALALIVLKGAALAETVYPRPSLRPFGDLDVLVRAEDAPRACALLSGLGYTVEAAVRADLLAGRSCQANFFRDTVQGPVVVELHTDLLNNSLLRSQIHIDHAGLWQRSVPATLAGKDALVLGQEDQLLHLCLHLAGHYFAAPKSLQDIVQVCAAASPDWDLFVALARQAGAGPACFGALSAAIRLRQAAVPAAVPEALAPPAGKTRLERLAVARAADTRGIATDPLRFPLLWELLGSGGPRVRVLFRVLVPAPRWLLAHYYFDLFDEAVLPPSPSQSLHGRLRYAWVLGRLYAAHLAFLGSRLARTVFRRTALEMTPVAVVL